MANLTEVVVENTISFYQAITDMEKQQEEYYNDLYKKSLECIRENIKMFDELKIDYKLVNSKGKAILTTEVLFFKEEGEPRLALELIGDCTKDENQKDKFLSYYNIEAGENSVSKQQPFLDEISLSLDYSNNILKILEVRPLGGFLNNFDILYSKK